MGGALSVAYVTVYTRSEKINLIRVGLVAILKTCRMIYRVVAAEELQLVAAFATFRNLALGGVARRGVAARAAGTRKG